MSGNDEEDAADLSSGLVANLLSLAKKKSIKCQRGKGWDLQKAKKTGKEFRWPKMEFLGPGKKLRKRPALWQKVKNRLDALACEYDICLLESEELEGQVVSRPNHDQSYWCISGKKENASQSQS